MSSPADALGVFPAATLSAEARVVHPVLLALLYGLPGWHNDQQRHVAILLRVYWLWHGSAPAPSLHAGCTRSAPPPPHCAPAAGSHCGHVQQPAPLASPACRAWAAAAAAATPQGCPRQAARALKGAAVTTQSPGACPCRQPPPALAAGLAQGGAPPPPQTNHTNWVISAHCQPPAPAPTQPPPTQSPQAQLLPARPPRALPRQRGASLALRRPGRGHHPRAAGPLRRRHPRRRCRQPSQRGHPAQQPRQRQPRQPLGACP
jgi:hypothetical protein